MNLREFNITFLGTSAASINPYSPTSAYLVEGGNTKIMIDAGFGALRQLRRIHVDPNDINAVLITHWHFDHFAGLAALLKSRKRTSLISIYGPKLTILARIFLFGLLYSNSTHFVAIKENFSKDCGDIRIETIPTLHDIVSFGWALTEIVPGEQNGNRRIVISGDTRPTQAIVKAAQGADLLVHEATYLNQAKTADIQKHSTVTEATNLAIQARAGALVLTHIGARYSKVAALKEAEKIFPLVLVPSPLDKIFIDSYSDSSKKENGGWGQVRTVRNRTGHNS